MSDVLQPAIEKFAEGDLQGAVNMLDDMCKAHKDIAAVHHTYAAVSYTHLRAHET